MELMEDTYMDMPEMQALLFVSNTVYFVLQRTDALRRLSKEETTFHIKRLANRTMRGLSFVEGHLPDNDEAWPLSKDMVDELESEYGNKVVHMLLDTHQFVEAAVVLCLYRNIKMLFEEKEQTCSPSCSRCLVFSLVPVLILVSIGLFFIFKF